MLGSTALGFYVLAVNLSGWPVAVFSQPVRAVHSWLVVHEPSLPEVTSYSEEVCE